MKAFIACNRSAPSVILSEAPFLDERNGAKSKDLRSKILRPFDAGHGLWPWALAQGRGERAERVEPRLLRPTARGSVAQKDMLDLNGYLFLFQLSHESSRKNMPKKSQVVFWGFLLAISMAILLRAHSCLLAEESKILTAGGLSYVVPSVWQEVPVSSPMRKAQFKVPKAEGDLEDGELAVFYFGLDQGGDLESNIKRWAGQFRGPAEVTTYVGQPQSGAAPLPAEVKPEVANQVVNGFNVSFISLQGTYLGGIPMQVALPKRDFAMKAAIVHGPQGNVFFKLVGPRKTVGKANDSFDALIQSIKV